MKKFWCQKCLNPHVQGHKCRYQLGFCQVPACKQGHHNDLHVEPVAKPAAQLAAQAAAAPGGPSAGVSDIDKLTSRDEKVDGNVHEDRRLRPLWSP